jgi:alkylated DNA repair dioxygenase AlkB
MEPPPTRVILDDSKRDCIVHYLHPFLTSEESRAWVKRFQSEVAFESERYTYGGRIVQSRRQSHAYGTEPLLYRYTGVRRNAAPWPVEWNSLLRKVEESVGFTFNFALFNLYFDHTVALGWHADDDEDLERDAPIASLSLGAERKFDFRGPQSLSLGLESGSLLTMRGATQRFYQHRVAPQSKSCDARINVTFRRVRFRYRDEIRIKRRMYSNGNTGR